MTLAKGLTVMRAFNGERTTMTLSETAAVTDLSRATARRILRTLTALGYVAQDGRQFSLTPRVLELGFGYLSSQSWIDQALPLLKELSASVQESCSAAILQGSDIVYVARIPTTRIMSAALTVGSRLPAFHTSLGRAQLGFVEDGELWQRIMSLRVEPYTTQTITEPRALFDRIKADRAAGLLHRRRRAGAGAPLDRRAYRGPPRSGGRGAEPLHQLHAHHPQPYAGAFLPLLGAVAAEISSFIA